MSGYVRVPKDLLVKYPDEAKNLTKDVYGVEPRLDKLIELFSSNPCILKGLSGSKNRRIIDLGGNSGYFSFGLISSGIASSAQVIDANKDFLQAGRRFARLLDRENQISFISRKIDLDFVRSEMGFFDITIINNLLHHAGYLFDAERVREHGWNNYLVEFLGCLYEKSDVVILGLGLKRSLPMFWLPPRFSRLSDNRYWHLKKLVEKTNWKICYFAFVDNLDTQLKGDLPKWKKVIGIFLEPTLKIVFMSRAWLEKKTGLKLRPAGLNQRKFYVMMVLSK